MLVDKNVNFRQKAVDTITKIRLNDNHSEGIRKFRKSKLNLNAEVYYEMIDINDIENITEPPVLKEVPSIKLRECIDFDQNFVWEMIILKCTLPYTISRANHPNGKHSITYSIWERKPARLHLRKFAIKNSSTKNEHQTRLL